MIRPVFKLQKSQRGMGLIEILIAVLVLGTALLTLSSLQSKSLQFNQGAYLRSQANILAYDIIDRIRINRTETNQYDVLFTASAPTGSSLRENDIKAWLNALAAALPQGDGQLTCNNSICKVEVQWNEQATGANNADVTATLSYTVQL